MVHVIASAALTPAVFWLGERWPIERHNWARRISAHLLFSACFALARVSIEALINAPLNAHANPAWDQGVGGMLVIMVLWGFHTGVIAYWVLLSIQFAFSYYAKFREREREALKLELHASELRAQVAQAHLSALKMQLQPHFLFNTLNAIVVLVRQRKVREAEQALTWLGDLLRAVLDDVDVQEVPLSRELEYLQLYLLIEQMRFSDRLEVRVDADPAVLEAVVPQMALQPIVENAVRHGIGRRVAKGTIEIRACRVDDMLRIYIKDNGPGFPQGAEAQGHGMGLSNLRARLNRLYGEDAMLRIESTPGQGTVVTVALPYRAHSTAGEALALRDFTNEQEGGRCALERVDRR